jgi:dienelactone hydrolase
MRLACYPENQTLADGPMEVQVSSYRPSKPENKAVLIFPPTGGTNLIDRSYARRLCRHGFTVYILNRWSGDDFVTDNLELHQRLYTLAAQAVGVVLKHDDSKFVGLLGTSVGALFAAVAAGTHERLDAVFTIVGGLTVPRVIVHSDQQAMVDLKARRYKLYGFKDDQEYQRRLTEAFPIEPTNLPRHFEKMDLGVSIATGDTTVPIDTQQAQIAFWKPSMVIEEPTGHFWGIVRTWLFHSRDIVRFFKDSSSRRLARK